MLEQQNNLYKYPLALTQQFRHCGNPFRADTYKGCSFGCKYCFANLRGGKIEKDFKVADIEIIKKKFYKAFDVPSSTKDLTVELLRHKVPIHLGGMSDPFQKAEFEYKATYKLLELTKKYRYPMMISTKAAFLPDEYYSVLDNQIHAFQISLISMDNNYIRRFEPNTPPPEDRVNFIKKLKSYGFWVGIRIQPLININEAFGVVKELSDIVDYITVEHIKIGNDNNNKRWMFEEMNLSPTDFKCCGREYELKTDIKLKNINELKAISKCPIGCGDNDLHFMSDSDNCCGIDTINSNFDGWIKYNSMYLNKGNANNVWYPKCNCSSCFNSEMRVSGLDFKGYVDLYMSAPPKEKQCNFKL